MPTTNNPKLSPSRSSERARALFTDPDAQAIAGGVLTHKQIRGFPPLDKPRRTEPAASDKVIRPRNSK